MREAPNERDWSGNLTSAETLGVLLKESGDSKPQSRQTTVADFLLQANRVNSFSMGEGNLDGKTQEGRKWLVAAVLVVLAVLLVARAVLFFESTNSPLAESSTQENVVQDVAGKGSLAFAPLDPMLHYALLERTERERYAGRGRNIFRADMELQTKKVPPPPPAPIPPAQSHQPILEKIRLKFFGFASIFNSPRKVFLIEGDDIFVATEGDIVNRRYRISRITSDSVQVEDLIEHSVHTLTLAG